MPKPTLPKTIKSAKKEELVKLLLLLAKEHPALKDKIQLFLTPKGEGTGKDYAKLVKQYLRKQTDRRYGMLKWDRLRDIYKHFAGLIEMLSAADKTDDVLSLCVEVIVQVNGYLHNSDDSYGNLQDTIAVAFIGIEKLVEGNKLDDEAKKRLFDKLLRALDDEHIYDFNAGGEICALLSNIIISEAQYAVFTAKMEAALQKEDSGSWSYLHHKELMVANSLQALQTLQMEEAAAQFILDNLQYKDIRKVLVKQCIAKEEYERAKTLIQEGIEIAKEKKHPGTVNEWEKMFLEIALNKNDDKAICRQVKHNLLHHHFTLANFLLYKKHSPKEDWENRRNEILERFSGVGGSLYDNTLLVIFKEEKMYTNLFNAIANYGNDFYVLDEYADVLIAHDKEKTIKLYLHRTEEFLEAKVSRKYYKVAVRYLKKIKKMGGDKEVQELVVNLRKIYSRRPSLLEEFRNL